MRRSSMMPIVVAVFLGFSETVWAEEAPVTASGRPATSGFLEEFPELKKHLYVEPDTHMRFGFGVAPIMVLKNKAGMSVNFFEVNWNHGLWDWSILSISYGTTYTGDALSKENVFTFRSIPRIRLSKTVSAGLVFGAELISFSNVLARLSKNNLESPIEPLSTQGFIYGAALSEEFRLSSRFTLKLNQLAYQETYDPLNTSNGWSYRFEEDSLNRDVEPIRPGLVFLLEVSLLY